MSNDPGAADQPHKDKMDALLRVILDDDRVMVQDMLSADSSLVAARVSEPRFYDQKIFHWLYAGDTALHLAAAGYRLEIVKLLGIHNWNERWNYENIRSMRTAREASTLFASERQAKR